MADIFTFPANVTVSTPTVTLSGNAAISYTLTDASSSPASIQFQYSVNGGPWQVATPVGNETTNLSTSPTGTTHTFIWNTQNDLDSNDDPSVQVRIAATDAIGTGNTQDSGSFAVDNEGVINSLTISFPDANNDTLKLVQTGSTINFSGVLSGSATNLTALTVMGGSGKNKIDASQVAMSVTLNGGSGSKADTLIGGSGSDTFLYSGTGSTYTGGTRPTIRSFTRLTRATLSRSRPPSCL